MPVSSHAGLAARNGKQLAVPANATRRLSLGYLPRLAVLGCHLRTKPSNAHENAYLNLRVGFGTRLYWPCRREAPVSEGDLGQTEAGLEKTGKEQMGHMEGHSPQAPKAHD